MNSMGLFTEAFMVHAWISCTVVAIVCAVTGFFVIVRGNSFESHALPQAGFAGGAGAVLININPLYGLMSFVIGSAMIIGFFSKKERNDIITALSLVVVLGIGSLFLGLANKYAAAAYALIFGQIVGISFDQVIQTIALGVISLLGVAFIYRPLLLSSIFKDIAETRNVPTRLVEILYMLVLGLVTSVTVPVVGALLCFSLLVVPAATSANISSNPQKVILLSVVIALVSTWISIVLAYYSNWPIGFFVAIIGGGLYFITKILSKR